MYWISRDEAIRTIMERMGVSRRKAAAILRKIVASGEVRVVTPSYVDSKQ
jgi:DNA-binding transcriptional regulator LsrR (DeoR family)